MGSVTLWMQMSLDGFAEAADQEAYWPVVDEELLESSLDELTDADMFLYGRKTYEMMADFWPSADTDPAISRFYVEYARCWKKVPKVVFSRTLNHDVGWNTQVVTRDLAEYVSALRAQPGCSMALLGGPQTAAAFMKHGLIDAYRVFVHPVLLGSGTPLFPSTEMTAGLTLVDVKTYDSAVVQFHYESSTTNCSTYSSRRTLRAV